MRTTSIGGIWNSSVAFMKANWVIIIGLYLAAIAICGILGWLFFGSIFTAIAMSPDPTMVFGMIMGVMGRMMLFGLIAATIFYGAVLSAYRHGLTNGQDSIGSNIGWALLAGLCLALVYIVAHFAFSLVFGVVLGAIGGLGASMMTPGAMPGAGLGFGAILMLVLFYVFILWLWSRLSVIIPNMAADRDVNPFTAISKSWNMTGASQWTIFGFMVLIILGVFIVGGILIAIFANLGSIGAILLLVLYIAFFIFLASIPAGIYKEVGPDRATDVFD